MEEFEVFTIAGTGAVGKKDGPGNEAGFNHPNGITIRDDGTIIVSDMYNNKIRGIGSDGNVFTIAGTENETTLNSPCEIALRNDGTIIVADTGNHKIKGIDLEGNVYTIAGTGLIGDKDGPGNEATFFYPNGIAVRDDGTMILADLLSNKIRGIDLDGNIYTIAGTGLIGDKDGSGNEATFYASCGIAIGNNGTMIVSDRSNHKIRCIDPDGNVYTIAGNGVIGDKDGPGNEASFNYPRGIAVRNDGTIIVADTNNHKIRGIDSDGNVFTIAGTGKGGDKDGPGNGATFNHPGGIAIREDGIIIVSDTWNHKIRGIRTKKLVKSAIE